MTASLFEWNDDVDDKLIDRTYSTHAGISDSEELPWDRDLLGDEERRYGAA